jgi:predicted AAA+ superfamily ATPase
MEKQTLYRFNEWWLTGIVRSELTGKFERENYKEIMERIEDRQVLLLYGLRRVGKTTTMYRIVSDLIRNGIRPTNILYFSFDEVSWGIDEVINFYLANILKDPITDAGPVYVFLDEIQKAEQWENRIKIFYDLYPNLKFVLSGSASLNTLRGSTETLAGRIFRIKIEPLSFIEFVAIKGKKVAFEKVQFARNILHPLFSEYIEMGGFPELVGETDSWKIRTYIRSIVIDRIITGDIPQEFGIRDMGLLKRLMEILLQTPGMIVNTDKLTSSLGRNRITISNFISYMEYAFLIKTVGNYRPGASSASRKLKKVYPYLPAFYSSLLPVNENYDMGKVYEAAVMNSLQPEYYYRSGQTEIDFVLKFKGRVVPIEVKSGHYDIKEVAKAFNRIGHCSGILINQNAYEFVKIDNTEIFLCPIEIFAMYPKEVLNIFLKENK